MIGFFHIVCSILALPFGAVILLRPKGTRPHVRLGWAYLTCMICVNVSALTIYDLTGRFNVFHLLAIINLAIITVAILHILYRRRMRKWLWRHYQYMSWSYIGLLAAALNEAMVRIPFLNHQGAGPSPSLQLSATTVMLVLSALVIFSMQKRLLAKYGKIGNR